VNRNWPCHGEPDARPDPDSRPNRPPRAISGLGAFFLLGCGIALITSAALAFPGGLLDPIWRLNPRAHEQLWRMGPWALVLLLPVATACGFAGVGLLRMRRSGYIAAIVLLSVNLAGDLVNVLLGIEPRAIIGVPIAAILIAYLLSRRLRSRFFRRSRQ
jgi:hypothetical protein